jgi:hypothetical protein
LILWGPSDLPMAGHFVQIKDVSGTPHRGGPQLAMEDASGGIITEARGPTDGSLPARVWLYPAGRHGLAGLPGLW